MSLDRFLKAQEKSYAGALDLVDLAADAGAGDFGVCRFLRYRGQD
jgi:hypothetical protein